MTSCSPEDGHQHAQVFLLSPAYCAGRRAAMLLRAESEMPLARRLRDQSLTLGETFSFLSGLYFRGKLRYATMFGRLGLEPHDATLIITPTRGLQRPGLQVTTALLQEFAAVDISADDPRYRVALERDVVDLGARLPPTARVVLLGSIATGKYVDVLCPTLGGRLHYPFSFVGRGDMSRGALLLRSADAGVELDYAVVEAGARARGPRPPKLQKLPAQPSRPAGF
jgi:hypothetical protein